MTQAAPAAPAAPAFSPSPVAQQAWSYEIFRRPQPLGEPGVINTLETMVRLVTEGMHDPIVAAWTSHRLREAGNPKDRIERARAIFDAFKREFVWVPDGKNTERIIKAPSFLKYFAGGDCDDLTNAVLACYMSSCLSMSDDGLDVDPKTGEHIGGGCAIVGASFAKNRKMSHVLGAIWERKRWIYVDPSGDFGFGKAVVPTRERVYDVPSGKMICDRDACLFGAHPVKPVFTPYYQISVVGHRVDELRERGWPGTIDTLDLFDDSPSAVGGSMDPSALSTDPPALPPDQQALVNQFDPAFARDFNADADALDATWGRCFGAYQTMLATAKAAGVMLPEPAALPDQGPAPAGPVFGFTSADVQVLTDIKALCGVMSTALRDAATKKRYSWLVPATAAAGANRTANTFDIAIEALPGDKYRIVKDAQGRILLEELANPGVQAHADPSSLGLGPAAIAGLVIVGLVSEYFIIRQVTETAQAAVENVTEAIKVTSYNDLIATGKATADQVANLQRTFAAGEADKTRAKGEAKQKAQESDPFTKAITGVIWLLGSIAAIGGIVLIGGKVLDDRSASRRRLAA